MVLPQSTRCLPGPYMVEHLKIFFSRTEKAQKLNLDSKSTKFVEMMILGWPLIVLWYGEICIAAVAILEEVAWHL